MIMKQVAAEDWNLWQSMDSHIKQKDFERCTADESAWLILEEEQPVGVFRWNYFWDSIPFLNLIYIREEFRYQGLGKQVLSGWESRMKEEGRQALLVSTQSDEPAQHFYRHLGFEDCGCLLFHQPELKQPAELFLVRMLDQEQE